MSNDSTHWADSGASSNGARTSSAPEPIWIDVEPIEPEADDGPRRPLHPWLVAGVVALIAVAVVAVVIRVGGEDQPDRPDVTGLAAADPRRVPAAVDVRWTSTLPGTGLAKSSEVLVHERDLVVVVVDDGSPRRGAIVGLDARDGTRRWRRGFPYAPEEFRLLGVVEDAVIVQRADLSGRRAAVGLDVRDGSTRWETTADEGGLFTILDGTRFVTQLPLTDGGPIGFIDPLSGEVTARIDGSIASTDLDGGWFLWTDDDLVFVDLTTPEIEPVIVARRGAASTDAVRVVDRTIAIGASAELRELTLSAPPRPIDVEGEPGLVVEQLIPVGGDRFVIKASSRNGRLLGAEVRGDRVEVVWEREIELDAVVPTERGVVLIAENRMLSADRLDDEFFVVDGVTGEDLGRIGVPRDDDATPLVAGDGFIVRRDLIDGEELSAFDLDGEPSWTVVVDGRVQLGDRLVATLESGPGGYVVSAYGDAL
jgi:hypothetical protein